MSCSIFNYEFKAHGLWTIMIRVCKLGLLLVPWVMVLLIRIPSSSSSPITMSLTSTIVLSSTPIRITLTFGISVPVISVTVIGVISIPLSLAPSKQVILTSPSIILKIPLYLTVAGSSILMIIPVIRVPSISMAM